MVEKLDACACGGKAYLVEYRCAEDAMEAFVECRKCGAETDHFEDAFAPRDDAAVAWNAGRYQPKGGEHAA